MGKCIYCGEKAGLFKSKHKDCEAKHENGKAQFIEIIRNSIESDEDYSSLPAKLSSIEEQSFISTELKEELIANGFDSAIESFLEDGILSEEEEQRALEFKEKLGLEQGVIDRNGSYTKLSMASVIRDLTEGKMPEFKITITGQLPFLFQKSEELIWAFGGVEYYEQQTRTEYQGGSQGLSFRVAKGVYYRASAFKGRPVKISEMKYVGTGVLAITTKHIYFGAPEKKLKIPFSKIISLEPYEDGIGVQKDGVTAKPQIFKNLDGWFAHNAISNLSQM